MPSPFTAIGAIHTVVSLVPVIAGIYSFVRHRKIDTTTRAGKTYVIGTALAVITAFGVSSTGHLNAGHAFGVVVLLVIAAAILVNKLTFLGRLRPYLSTLGLSFSFFMSLVPATNETLTRLPVSHPLASAPLNPLVQHVLLVWFVMFVLGFVAQCWHIRVRNKALALA